MAAQVPDLGDAKHRKGARDGCFLPRNMTESTILRKISSPTVNIRVESGSTIDSMEPGRYLDELGTHMEIGSAFG